MLPVYHHGRSNNSRNRCCQPMTDKKNAASQRKRQVNSSAWRKLPVNGCDRLVPRMLTTPLSIGHYRSDDLNPRCELQFITLMVVWVQPSLHCLHATLKSRLTLTTEGVVELSNLSACNEAPTCQRWKMQFFAVCHLQNTSDNGNSFRANGSVSYRQLVGVARQRESLSIQGYAGWL